MRGNEKEGEWTYWERNGIRWLKFDYGDGLERVKLGEIEERDAILEFTKLETIEQVAENVFFVFYAHKVNPEKFPKHEIKVVSC